MGGRQGDYLTEMGGGSINKKGAVVDRFDDDSIDSQEFLACCGKGKGKFDSFPTLS